MCRVVYSHVPRSKLINLVIVLVEVCMLECILIFCCIHIFVRYSRQVSRHLYVTFPEVMVVTLARVHARVYASVDIPMRILSICLVTGATGSAYVENERIRVECDSLNARCNNRIQATYPVAESKGAGLVELFQTVAMRFNMNVYNCYSMRRDDSLRYYNSCDIASKLLLEDGSPERIVAGVTRVLDEVYEHDATVTRVPDLVSATPERILESLLPYHGTHGRSDFLESISASGVDIDWLPELAQECVTRAANLKESAQFLKYSWGSQFGIELNKVLDSMVKDVVTDGGYGHRVPERCVKAAGVLEEFLARAPRTWAYEEPALWSDAKIAVDAVLLSNEDDFDAMMDSEADSIAAILAHAGIRGNGRLVLGVADCAFVKWFGETNQKEYPKALWKHVTPYLGRAVRLGSVSANAGTMTVQEAARCEKLKNALVKLNAKLRFSWESRNKRKFIKKLWEETKITMDEAVA